MRKSFSIKAMLPDSGRKTSMFLCYRLIFKRRGVIVHRDLSSGVYLYFRDNSSALVMKRFAMVGKIINTTQIGDRDLLASFDVQSLYPSITIDEALYQIATNKDFPDHIIDLAIISLHRC